MQYCTQIKLKNDPLSIVIMFRVTQPSIKYLFMLIPMLRVQSWNMIGLALLHIAITLMFRNYSWQDFGFQNPNFLIAAGPLSLIYENHIIASWLAT